MNTKKPTLGMKEPTVEQPANTDTVRPKNPPAGTIPSVGYVLEVDGKFKSEFETSEAAMKSGLDSSRKNIRRSRSMCTTQKSVRERWWS